MMETGQIWSLVSASRFMYVAEGWVEESLISFQSCIEKTDFMLHTASGLER